MRIVIWGAGNMGWTHGEAYQKLGGDVKIAAVISKNREHGERFAGYFGCALCQTLEELPRGTADAIDICLPTFMHLQAIVEALKVCPYLLCEKPLCLSLEEYTQLEEAVAEAGGRVMVGHVLRFWNGYEKVRELAEAGVIGKIRFVTCTRRQKMPRWSRDNWLMDREKSGGLLLDLCIHDVDYVNWILGLPRRVFCETVEGQDGTGLHSIITMGYDGCCASVVGSWGMPEAYPFSAALELVGDLGMVSYQGGDEVSLMVAGEKSTVSLEPSDGYLEEIRYFTDCVKMGTAPEISDMKSVKGTMQILWAAGQAGASGQIVYL